MKTSSVVEEKLAVQAAEEEEHAVLGNAVP